MNHRIALCMMTLLLASMPCVAAEFFYMDHDPFTNQYVGPTGPLVISGEIVPGDYDRLLSRILDDEDRFLRPIDDLKQMLKCRTRITQDAARQAVVLASKERLGRGGDQAMKGAEPKSH